MVASFFAKITKFSALFIVLFFSNASSLRKTDEGYCICNKNEISCRDFQDPDQLNEKLQDIKSNCTVSRLQITHCDLAALPNDFLLESSFTELRLKESSMPFLSVPFSDENPFNGGELITKIVIEKVLYPYNWNWTVLNACQDLNSLRIKNSDMVYIGHTFKNMNLTSLRALVIEKSRVRWIEAGAFSAFKNLAFFQFLGNEIKYFERSFLPNPAINLHAVNFKNNDLEYLDEDLFLNMPELTYVNLQNNNLETVSEFKDRSFFVDLAGNPFQCDCSIQWLQKSYNNTDIFRIHCFMPDNEERVPVRKVSWSKLGCVDI
ncbi:slit homolog 1 protein-like [Uloborus diversus]|uniref:slit homolog 1 protein-like n=1 Tax=Uloborus diversus TaxID=327109 RepID=UPI00240A5C3D|nr:slit homolog 1 protein-like [Uloborus diversus]